MQSKNILCNRKVGTVKSCTKAPVGNITYLADGVDATVYYYNGVNSGDNDYSYDALYRLLLCKGREHQGNNGATTNTDSSRTRTTDPTPLNFPVPYTDITKVRRYEQRYDYDQVGNMTQMAHIVTGGTGNWTRTMSIDTDSNKLLTSSIGSSTTGSESYDYDNRGNIIDGFNHLTSMTYNEENRLEVVVDGDTNITTYYQYDSGGQRVRKVKVNGASGGFTEVRKYVGQWEVYTKSKTSVGTLLLQRETLHIMDDKARVALIDTPVYDSSGGGEGQLLRYQFSNHLGTASLELDDVADIISYEEYYPYGSTAFQSGRTLAEVSLKRYRYTGKERDEETGLYYHGARYYCPWLARWCAVDPLESKFSPESSYCYGHNNPVRLNDPTGMGAEEKVQGTSPKHIEVDAEIFIYSDEKNVVTEENRANIEKNINDQYNNASENGTYRYFTIGDEYDVDTQVRFNIHVRIAGEHGTVNDAKNELKKLQDSKVDLTKYNFIYLTNKEEAFSGGSSGVWSVTKSADYLKKHPNQYAHEFGHLLNFVFRFPDSNDFSTHAPLKKEDFPEGTSHPERIMEKFRYSIMNPAGYKGFEYSPGKEYLQDIHVQALDLQYFNGGGGHGLGSGMSIKGPGSQTKPVGDILIKIFRNADEGMDAKEGIDLILDNITKNRLGIH